MGKYVTWVFIIFLSTSFVVSGQDSSHDFYNQSLRINNTGMLVLGSWALANITVGAVGWANNQGQRKYFHQMNLFWNAVNLSIAGLSLYGNMHSNPGLLSPQEMLGKQYNSQRLFLINAGLDVAYMGTGILLRTLSPRSEKFSAQLAGYGNSVMVQGAFLFVFDLAMFGIQRSHRMAWLDQLSLVPMSEALGISASLAF